MEKDPIKEALATVEMLRARAREIATGSPPAPLPAEEEQTVIITPQMRRDSARRATLEKIKLGDDY